MAPQPPMPAAPREQAEATKGLLLVAALCAILGVGVSLYTIFHHLEVKAHGTSQAFCNISAKLNCDTIALSPYSELAGFPLGAWGLGYFLALLLLLGLAWQRPLKYATYLAAYTIAVGIGLGVCLLLAGISFFALSSFCPSCLLVYSLCLGQGLNLWRARSRLALWPCHRGQGLALALCLLPIGMSLGSYQLLATQGGLFLPDSKSVTEVVELADINSFSTLSPNPVSIPIASSPYAGLGEDFRLGPEEAAVTIVEFSDFQCPACKRISEPLKILKKELGEGVRIVYKNFPLDQSCNPYMPGPMHALACKMAVLARCAGQYGKFWQYHDLLFERQSQAEEGKLVAWALEVGLKQEQVQACLESKSILEKIKDDIKLAQQLGVNSTPTLFVNGHKYTGQGAEALRLEVENLLQRQQQP